MNLKPNGLNLNAIDFTFNLQLSELRGEELRGNHNAHQPDLDIRVGVPEPLPSPGRTNPFVPVSSHRGRLFYWGKVTIATYPQTLNQDPVPREACPGHSSPY